MSEVVGVQFLEGGKIHLYLSPGPRLKVDALCVVETEHGPTIARVARINVPQLDRKAGGPMRRVLRTATPRDMEQRKNNERLERDAYRLCRQKVQEKKLAMKLVDVAYTLEGRKAIFYFTAENRVDFRELVKDLAQVLRIKIEMRQIGVRDEARRLGGVGACGHALCCCSFLKDFVSVSIRMAKDQNVSLNPTKVSGICGRLMCCLSYEYDPAKGKRKKGEDKPGADGEPVPACGTDCRGCEAGEAKGTEPNRAPDRRTPPSFRPGGSNRPGSPNQPGGPQHGNRRREQGRPERRPEAHSSYRRQPAPAEGSPAPAGGKEGAQTE